MVINCKKPCKKKRSTMLTVEQMVDIALGTPEIGAVNFNVLHALIHVIIQQLNIQKCLVEFKGYDSDRMEGIILSAKPGPILKLSEYMIDVNEGRPCSGKERSSKQGKEDEECKEEGKDAPSKKPPCECMGKKKKSSDEEKEKSDKGKEERDVEDKKKTVKKELTPEECQDAEEPEPKKIKEVKKPCPCKAAQSKEQEGICADENLKLTPSSYYGSDSEGACQTIVRVEPVGERCDSWRSRPALAHESMVKLEEKVAMLQDAFEALEQMPTNEELKKRTQGTSCVSTPVKDLWQLYNLNKRVESCEGTIEKLASMIEDLVKETCNFREAMMVIASTVDDMECSEHMTRSCCAALQTSHENIMPFGIQNPNKVQIVQFAECDGKPCDDDKEPQNPFQQPKTAKPSAPAAPQPKPPNPQQDQQTAPDQSTAAASDSAPSKAAPASDSQPQNPENETSDPAQGQAVDVTLPSEVKHIGPGQLDPIGPEFYKMTAGEKFCTLKEYVDCLTCHVKTLAEKDPGKAFAAKFCALLSLQKQMDSMEKEWREFMSFFEPNGAKGIILRLQQDRSDIERMDDLLQKMKTEQKDTGSALKAISEEANNLRKVKADLEHVEDLLAGKADASLLNRKVSHDQFDAACDDLTRGLDEALDKLLQQEAMWNEALEELQKNLDNKLDKIEIMPLKEFINKKLKCLQEKLKQLAQLRKDAEAAGAKSRILRNLNCIACDAEVVMKIDNRSSVQHPAMSGSKNIKPMLTYELDQVRKAMKKGPCRAPPHIEDTCMDAQKKSMGIPLTTKEAVDNKVSKLAHFCNRYCGGSHTITTPQQRVTRIGHFLTEFGPQAMALFNQECEELKEAQQANLEADFNKPC